MKQLYSSIDGADLAPQSPAPPPRGGGRQRCNLGSAYSHGCSLDYNGERSSGILTMMIRTTSNGPNTRSWGANNPRVPTPSGQASPAPAGGASWPGQPRPDGPPDPPATTTCVAPQATPPQRPPKPRHPPLLSHPAGTFAGTTTPRSPSRRRLATPLGAADAGAPAPPPPPRARSLRPLQLPRRIERCPPRHQGTLLPRLRCGAGARGQSRRVDPLDPRGPFPA